VATRRSNAQWPPPPPPPPPPPHHHHHHPPAPSATLRFWIASSGARDANR
jgi:hypothetical protein